MPCARREQRCSGCALGHVVETVGYPPHPLTPPLSRLAYGTAVMGTAATGAAGVGIETRPDTGGAMLQA